MVPHNTRDSFPRIHAVTEKSGEGATDRSGERNIIASSGKLLIVEDEVTLIRAFKRMFSPYFSGLLISENFKEAVEIIGTKLTPGDIVISDFHLHGNGINTRAENGIELAEITQSVRNGLINFILMSGGIDHDGAEGSRLQTAMDKHAIDAFLDKPFGKPEFQKVLHDLRSRT